MKFSVPSKLLYGYVSAVSKVINSKNPMPILYNFLFELSGDTLKITASDLENTLTGIVPVTGTEGEGKFCIDARRLNDLLKSMPDVGITIEVNDENLAIKISSTSGKFDFIGINGNEYPSKGAEEDDPDAFSFTCPSEVLISGIENTTFAVGTDQLRPQMMGILLDVNVDSLTFVATDTRKLVKYRNSKIAPDKKGSCIIPLKPATVIRSVFPRESEVKVTIDKKRAIIESETFTFTCQLLKGMFPDYNRVIPANNPYVLTVDRQSLLSALRQVSVCGDQGQNQVKFKIEPSTLTLKTVDNNFCTQGIESIACDFNGREMVIGFSAPYLVEILSTINTTDIVAKLSDPSRPGVFLPSETGANEELTMLLMPMNVTDF